MRILSGLEAIAVAVALLGAARAIGPPPINAKELELEDPDDQCVPQPEPEVKTFVAPERAPRGSEYTSLAIGENGEEFGLYRTADPVSRYSQHAHIIVHGKNRDAGRYWRRMNDGIRRARRRGYPGSGTEALVLAPVFFSTIKNASQFTEQQLAWCGSDLDEWQGGGQAVHPRGTNLSSFDVLDALLAHLADPGLYPRLTNVTLFGHSAGGQLVQRYAAVGHNPPSRIHVRYIHASESKYAYFTPDRPRPIEGGSPPSRAGCPRYNAWPYGFERLNLGRRRPEDYFRQYATRDVVSIVGYRDVKRHGDQTCMAQFQGGHARRSRNLIWYRYLHELARTGQDLSGFPGRFDNLPDWSGLTNGSVSLRIIVIESLGHNPVPLLRSKAARPALFGDGNFTSPTWRPDLEEDDRLDVDHDEDGDDHDYDD
ncbi:hypothetical protein HIM_01038 [Hirsutella minnesotensis 3608]|nr:hypothetical protein HIM_01038 [Hirsutella minnesotensis 3608]